MSDRAVFARRADRAFQDLPLAQARRIQAAILELMEEPHARLPGHGAIKLAGAPVAPYRRRVGTWRILFDVDDRAQVIEIVDIRKRDEQTYRAGTSPRPNASRCPSGRLGSSESA